MVSMLPFQEHNICLGRIKFFPVSKFLPEEKLAL